MIFRIVNGLYSLFYSDLEENYRSAVMESGQDFDSRSVDHLGCDSGQLVSIPESFPCKDPLGLNGLADTIAPTYSYSLDEGLHNFIIPISSTSSSFVVAGTSFSLAPLVVVAAAEGNSSDQSSGTAFTLVSASNESGARLQKNYRCSSSLQKLSHQGLQGEPLDLQCEWDECRSAFTELTAFLDHVADHVNDVPIVSTKVSGFFKNLFLCKSRSFMVYMLCNELGCSSANYD
jgi:hypothetical protein